MRTLRVLFQIGRADFLDRARRYSFLVTLAFALYLGWAAASGRIVLRLEDYRGVYNSAWVGGMMTAVTTSFLSLAGFYLVKNSVERDRRTGVGEILATTPLRKLHYTVGKTLSNFVFLAAMVVVLALSAGAMQLLKGEERGVEPWILLMPFILIALPAMAVVAALAVLFETVPGLRGGAGNVAWFFTWSFGLTLGLLSRTPMADFSGITLLYRSMSASVPVANPSFNLTMGETGDLKTFVWPGLDWTADVIASRALMIAAAFGIAALAALVFDRFDPSRRGPRFAQGGSPTPAQPAMQPALQEPPAAAARLAAPAPSAAQAPSGARAPSMIHDTAATQALAAGPAVPDPLARPGSLTSLRAEDARFSALSMVVAELRVLLKGARWWWLAGAAGMAVAMLVSPLAVSLRILCFAWLWPVLLWSSMGTREGVHGTGPIVFSSARSLVRQLPAAWMAGVVLALATGGAAGLRLLLAGEARGFCAWLVGALFIPTLALALGVWSGTSRFFEALYTALWYVGPLQAVPGLDFMGVSPAARASGIPLGYLALTGCLLAATFVGRLRQIRA